MTRTKETFPVVGSEGAASDLKKARRTSFQAAPNDPSGLYSPLQFSKCPHIPELKSGHPEPAQLRDDLTLKGVAGVLDKEEAKQIWTEAGDEGLQ